MLSLNELRRVFRGDITIGEPLAKHTTFRVGGPADYYLEPVSAADLARAIDYLRKRRFPFLFIVPTSHLLVSDGGYRGAVINVESCLSSIRMTGDQVCAAGAARLGALSEFCLERGLAGAEIVAGLQGTVAGGIVRNVGALGKTLRSRLVSLEVLREGTSTCVEPARAVNSLNLSGEGKDIIFSATFRFPRGEKEELLRLGRELLVERNALQPINVPGGGSIFKDTADEPATRLLQRAGVRVRRHGGATVAAQHVNCIINEGGAKSSDIVALIRTMQRAVRDRLDVHLELGVRMVGFDDSVLREVA